MDFFVVDDVATLFKYFSPQNMTFKQKKKQNLMAGLYIWWFSLQLFLKTSQKHNDIFSQGLWLNIGSTLSSSY